MRHVPFCKICSSLNTPVHNCVCNLHLSGRGLGRAPVRNILTREFVCNSHLSGCGLDVTLTGKSSESACGLRLR
jgi:hypothetical protein